MTTTSTIEKRSDAWKDTGYPGDAIAPPALSDVEGELVSAVSNGIYDLVLVDFLLDQETTESGQGVTYRGGTPAAMLKEWCPHVPVVLVTTEEKYRAHLRHRSQLSELFDHSLLKGRVLTRGQRARVAEELTDLALGFRRLRSVLEAHDVNVRWERLREALAATDDEFDRLRKEWPSELPESASELARWLLKELIEYPGPLRDHAETAVLLGVTETAMNGEPLRKWMKPSVYEGVFARMHERWWSGRLLTALKELLGESALLPSGERAAALAKTLRLREPYIAQCSWCEEPIVHRVCRFCGDPVDATHHLKVRRSQRPLWALPAVVCFRCIETGQDQAAAGYYGPGTTELIEDLRAGRLRDG